MLFESNHAHIAQIDGALCFSGQLADECGVQRGAATSKFAQFNGKHGIEVGDHSSAGMRCLLPRLVALDQQHARGVARQLPRQRETNDAATDYNYVILCLHRSIVNTAGPGAVRS